MGLPQAEDESTCVRTFGEFEFAISGIGDCHSDSSGLTGSTFGDNLPFVRFLLPAIPPSAAIFRLWWFLLAAFAGYLPSVAVYFSRLRRHFSACGSPFSGVFRLWQPDTPPPQGGSPLRLGQVFERKVVVCTAGVL